MSHRLTDPWMLGPLEVPNRVLLAPLAGIGNWFVRLQAKRYGAGMAVSEMVSSHAIHHGNEKTCTEMLRIHPDEREPVPFVADEPRWDGGSEGTAGTALAVEGVGARNGVVSIQLFGEDPDVMRSAAARVRAVGADVIDINMGCPVPKVQKTGAGAALLADHDRAVAVARAASEGGGGLPVTVKLRSGRRVGETDGFELAHRLVAEAGVAAIGFHPRSAAVHHKGVPDYELVARLVASLDAPVILTGGLNEPQQIEEAFHSTGAAAVMLARGALGNPWLFERLLGARSDGPSREEVLGELGWTIDRAVEHLGEPRATRYLRKFYPWYIQRLGLDRQAAKELQAALQEAEALSEARNRLAILLRPRQLEGFSAVST
ncbi:MAG: tRNA dihydrouridine synthase [Solirubrobacteraceae bacterium]